MGEGGAAAGQTTQAWLVGGVLQSVMQGRTTSEFTKSGGAKLTAAAGNAATNQFQWMEDMEKFMSSSDFGKKHNASWDTVKDILEGDSDNYNLLMGIMSGDVNQAIARASYVKGGETKLIKLLQQLSRLDSDESKALFGIDMRTAAQQMANFIKSTHPALAAGLGGGGKELTAATKPIAFGQTGAEKASYAEGQLKAAIAAGKQEFDSSFAGQTNIPLSQRLAGLFGNADNAPQLIQQLKSNNAAGYNAYWNEYKKSNAAPQLSQFQNRFMTPEEKIDSSISHNSGDWYKAEDQYQDALRKWADNGEVGAVLTLKNHFPKISTADLNPKKDTSSVSGSEVKAESSVDGDGNIMGSFCITADQLNKSDELRKANRHSQE
jgi:hypothetical protein